MVKRRRTTRNTARRKSQPQRSNRKRQNKSLKEKLLTTAIWGLSLINVTLIISLVSNFFTSPNEISVNAIPNGLDVKPSEITIEVLNACGVQGLANQVTEYLRANNFDVVEVGNYSGEWNLEQTFVFDRVSLDRVYAKKVGAVLGVKDDQIAPQLEASLQLKVTVLIGKDYQTLKTFKK